MSSCLLIGPPGSGKTTAACTLAKLYPLGVIDFDNKLHKMENVKHLLRSKENPIGNLIQIPIDCKLSTISLREMATTKLEQGGKQTSARPEGYMKFVEITEKLQKDKYKWEGVQLGGIVLDSYTTMQEHLKRLLLSANDKMTMSLPLYGPFLTNLEEVNNIFIRMPIDVIIIAHEKMEKDPLTERIIVRPMVEGSMDGKIAKDFEEVYYMQKVISGLGAGTTAKYEMMTIGDSMRSARTSRKQAALVEPDFSKIFGGGK